jgi:diguanylate cyclase (GGDEF)-like protein/PAS domain S-box-containing protein
MPELNASSDQALVDQDNLKSLTESLLRDKLSRLQSLLDMLPGIAFTCETDAELSMRFLSQGCFEITGYRPDELLQLPLGYNSLIYPEDLQKVLNTVKVAAQREQSYEVDYRIATRFGQEVWIHEQGNFVFDEAERILSVQGLISNITRLKETELQLLRQRQLLNTVATATVYFLDCSDFSSAVTRTLELLGHAAGVDRVYIYENHLHPETAEMAMSMRYEWTQPSIQPSIQQPHWQNQRYAEYGLDMWYQQLSQGQAFKAITRDLPLQQRSLLSKDQILSICLVPIFTDQDFWGYIGFDDCCQERVWSQDEESILLTMAASIGSALKRKRAEQALIKAELRYQQLFDNAVDGIFQTTESGQYLSVNPALARIYGYESPQDLLTHLTDIREQLYVDKQRYLQFREAAKEKGYIKNFESQVYRKDGSIIWISENARAVFRPNNTVEFYEGFVKDITERKLAEMAREHAEKKLRHAAFHDGLTGLANRSFFVSSIKQEICLCKRDQNYQFVVLFLDLDHFKLINDTLGHDVGDQLLIETSQRLKSCLRESDTIARWGGDEFTILIRDVRREDDIFLVIERIQSALSTPFQLADRRNVSVTASIGISRSSSDSISPQDLLRDADLAMYSAKANGRATYEVFQAGMRERAIAQLNLELDLRRAIDQNELILNFQPILALQTDELFGFEALIRWKHRERGILFPHQFLPLAEGNGLITLIDFWVLKQVCSQLQKWRRNFNLSQFFRINVNISGRSFAQADFLDRLSRILKQTHTDPAQLNLEITETALMEKGQVMSSMISSLKEQGLGLHIDDFGSGYSSLSYLRHFSFDCLKIDRSFVTEISENHQSREITKTIIQLAHALQTCVIAEGIETAEQLQVIKSLGCEFVQGYLFSPPLTLSESELLLSRPIR